MRYYFSGNNLRKSVSGRVAALEIAEIERKYLSKQNGTILKYMLKNNLGRLKKFYKTRKDTHEDTYNRYNSTRERSLAV